jgi:hydrogenase maturation protease
VRSLVIGYGNSSRRDDGVALHVVNALRARWGQPSLPHLSDGWDELGGVRDSLFLQQLAPELAATLVLYGRVIFVDASLPAAPEPVHVEEVAARYRLAAISHHLEPAVLLALTARLYGRAPQGFLVSVRGHDFDFGEELSPETAAAVPQAVERVAALIEHQNG